MFARISPGTNDQGRGAAAGATDVVRTGKLPLTNPSYLYHCVFAHPLRSANDNCYNCFTPFYPFHFILCLDGFNGV